MGRVCQVPRKHIYDTSSGHPLFWAERKSKKFWGHFLFDLQAAAVMDMTPGSGSCARGCIDFGINYTCIIRSPEHASWLQNVLDLYALHSICESGKPLFEQDLATCVKEHFQYVLDQVKAADEQEDVDQGFDPEQDGAMSFGPVWGPVW
jgi:hypothetical protein